MGEVLTFQQKEGVLNLIPDTVVGSFVLTNGGVGNAKDKIMPEQFFPFGLAVRFLERPEDAVDDASLQGIEYVS